MKKIVLILLVLCLCAAVFVLPASALSYWPGRGHVMTMPNYFLWERPIEPYFSYTRFCMDDVAVVLVDDTFYVLDNGKVRVLIATPDSVEIEGFFHLMLPYYHGYTEQLRWFGREDYNPQFVVPEIIFDFASFSYTIINRTIAYWLNDPAFMENLERLRADGYTERWTRASAWRNTLRPAFVERTSAMARGEAASDVLLQMLTDPDFVPEGPETQWVLTQSGGSLGEIVERFVLVPLNVYDAPDHAWQHLLAFSAISFAWGAMATSAVFALVLRRKRKKIAAIISNAE